MVLLLLLSALSIFKPGFPGMARDAEELQVGLAVCTAIGQRHDVVDVHQVTERLPAGGTLPFLREAQDPARAVRRFFPHQLIWGRLRDSRGNQHGATGDKAAQRDSDAGP